jgi:hypothetical protein
MRFVESTDNTTLGASTTTTLAVVPATKDIVMHIMEAEEAEEVFKAMVMVAVEMEVVKEMASTILTRLHQKLQSRDSQQNKHLREPKGNPSEQHHFDLVGTEMNYGWKPSAGNPDN